ncbi:MAG: tetratricopeptide repeat protein [Planctomycetota bacterium]|jgi:TolA-binding protein
MKVASLAVAVFVLGAPLLGGGVAFGEGTQRPVVDARYEGKYPAAVIRPFIDALTAEAPAAYERATAALGATAPAGMHPLLRIRDAAPLAPGRTAAPAAKTFAEPGPGGLTLIVQFHSEHLVNATGDLKKRLLHEMVHAAMRLALGDDRYANVPVWLREGIALHVADQGIDRVRYEFTIALDGESLLDGLGGEHGPEDYGEDFLAVDFMARRAGSGWLHGLMAALSKGMDPAKAVEKIAGMKESPFEPAFRNEVLTSLERSAAMELRDFMPPFDLFRAGEYARALEGFGNVHAVKGGAKGLLAGALEGKRLYYRAKCLFQLGRITEAAPLFAKVRRDHGRTCGLADDAAFFEAECHRRVGRIAQAKEGFLLVVRDFPNSNYSALANHKLGLCAYQLGDYPFARRWCLDTWRAFPSDPVAENALYDGANSARAEGDPEEALRLFRFFVKTYPESRFRAMAEKRIEKLHEKTGREVR